MRAYSTRAFYLAGLCSLLVLSCTSEPHTQEVPPATTTGPVLLVHAGVQESGHPTPTWIEAIRRRHDEETIARLQEGQKKLTPEEKRWEGLIRSKVATWSGWVDSLSIPFKKITPPGTVTIVLGNAGGADAFTYADSTIGFDLSELYQIYGHASTPENDGRIDRFFAHEMTHILHKAWRKKHGVSTASPLEYALWDCLVEGIGNYRSLSSKWVSKDGVLTSRAHAVLADLQPLFVERLLALEGASEEDAVHLLEGLSSGPFTKKWGALTSALWLAQEAKGDDARLQPWVEAGPWGILDLADKYLPEELGDKLSEITKP